MNKVALLCLLVVGCAKSEPPKADSAKAPPAPVNLSAADIAGTWNGTGSREGDTTKNHWVAMSVTDSTGMLVIQGVKDTVPFRTTFSADSFISTSSAPYTDPSMPKGMKANFRAVGRLKDGKMTGTTYLMLAAKPDSVVGKSSWEATKAP